MTLQGFTQESLPLMQKDLLNADHSSLPLLLKNLDLNRNQAFANGATPQ